MIQIPPTPGSKVYEEYLLWTIWSLILLTELRLEFSKEALGFEFGLVVTPLNFNTTLVWDEN